MKISNNTDIDQLRIAGLLSQRSFNALKSAGLWTLAQVAQRHAYGKGGLRDLRNFGAKCRAEVEALIAQLPSDWTSEHCPYGELDGETRRVLEVAFAETEGLPDGAREALRKRFPTPESLYQAIVESSDEALYAVDPGLSLADNAALRRWVVGFFSRAARWLASSLFAEQWLLRTLEERAEADRRRLPLSVADLAAYAMGHEAVAKNLENEYNRLLSLVMAPKAAFLIRQSMPSFADFAPMLDAGEGEFSKLLLTTPKAKAVSDACALASALTDYLRRMVDCCASLSKLSTLDLATRYPLLNAKQIAWMAQFVAEHGYEPVFYALDCSLRESEDRRDIFFCLRYGLDGKPGLSLQDIAVQYGVTSERVRQILALGAHAIASLAKEVDLAPYEALLGLPVIAPDTDAFCELRALEGLQCGLYGFAAMLGQLTDAFAYESADGCEAMLRRDACAGIDFGQVAEAIDSLAKQPRCADEVVHYSSLLPGCPPDALPLLRDLALAINRQGLRTPSSEIGLIFLKNKIDFEAELCGIIEQNGRPMHVNDIFARFKERYPDHKYACPSQLKSWLGRIKKIKPQGKSSTFGLAAWADVEYATIKQLAVDMLAQADEPLPLDMIVERVLEVYPGSNRNSVDHTMRFDSKKRFAVYEGGRIGLSSRTYGADYNLAKARVAVAPEERLQQLRAFVEANKRFPTLCADEDEAALARWVSNYSRSDADDALKQEFADFIAWFDSTDMPRTASEAAFRRNCDAVKAAAPNLEPSLRHWLQKARRDYLKLQGKKKKYFDELLEECSKEGRLPACPHKT